MLLKKSVLAVSLLFSLSSCGGGSSSSGGGAGSIQSSSIGCSQHSDFFQQLSGERIGTVSTFSSPSVAACDFDVTLTINNDPNFTTCQVSANVAYTSRVINSDSSRVCDSSEGRRFNVLFGEAIALSDQINLPLRLIFQPVGAQPLQNANGELIEYPIFGGSNVEVDTNFNIGVEGQVLTRP